MHTWALQRTSHNCSVGVWQEGSMRVYQRELAEITRRLQAYANGTGAARNPFLWHRMRADMSVAGHICAVSWSSVYRCEAALRAHLADAGAPRR